MWRCGGVAAVWRLRGGDVEVAWHVAVWWWCGVAAVWQWWWWWCGSGVEVVPWRTALPWSSPGSAAGGGAAAPG